MLFLTQIRRGIGFALAAFCLILCCGCIAQPDEHYTVYPSTEDPRQARLGGMVTDQILEVWEDSDRDAAATLETLRNITTETPIVVNDEWPTNKTPTEYWSDAIDHSKRFSFNAAVRAVSLRPENRSLRIVLAGPKTNRRVAFWSWYVRDFEGRRLRYEDETPPGFANILDYGVAVNDETDQATAIVAAFQGEDNPAQWYFPKGEYCIATRARTVVTEDIEIRCHPDTIFKITVDGEGFLFSPRGTPNITWTGGTFDGTNQPVSQVVPWRETYPPANSGSSNVAGSISITGSANGQFGHIAIRDVVMENHPTHWSLAGGDQSLAIGSCQSALIENCVFRSARDLGIYFSDRDPALETSSVNNAVIRNCRFENCAHGAAVKRGGIDITVDQCEFVNCLRGFISQRANQVGAGTNVTVKNSTFERCWEAVLLETTLIATVEDNTFTDMGHAFPGNTVPNLSPFVLANGNQRRAIALRSNGSAYITFRNNIVSGKATTWTDRPVTGVFADQDDGNPNYFLLVNENIFEDIDILAQEVPDVTSFTVVRDNTLSGEVAPFVPRNEGSTYDP